MTKPPPLARDFMATQLVTLTPSMDVFDCISLLLKHRISGAPVVGTDGKFLGVFSEKNCMSVLVKAAYDQLPTSEVIAFTDTNPHTISEDTDLLAVAQLFLSTSARRLPVLRDGELVGQISRRDVLRAAHELMAVAKDKEAALLYLSSLVERHESPIRA